MKSLHSRRNLLRVLAALTAAPALALRAKPVSGATNAALRQLEKRAGGRLGVSAIDTGSKSVVGHRENERFPMCSTFKLMLSSAVMAGAGRLSREAGFSHESVLARQLRVEKKHLVAWAPIAERHVGEEMTVASLCDAAVRYSDNAAANLLLELIGGPPAFTAYARSLGDAVTRLDRTEPKLNTSIPGDVRDTTSPAAMRDDLISMVLSDKKPVEAREQLRAWMVANTTGDKRIRAGTPAGWIVGDKTGTGANGATNDIAIIWPAGRAPIAMAIYFVGAKGTQSERDAVVAEAAGIVLAALS